MVESQPSKLLVASSILVSRSNSQKPKAASLSSSALLLRPLQNRSHKLRFSLAHLIATKQLLAPRGRPRCS